MTAAIPSDEEFDIELKKRLDKLRERRSEGLPTISLAWLALAPAWTKQLATNCQYPLEGLTLAEFLEQATAAHLCEQSRDGSSSGFETWHRARAIAAIGARLSPERLPGLVQKLLDIPDARTRVDALTLLLSRLPQESRAELANITLSEAQKIEDSVARLESIMRMADYLPAEQKSTVIQRSFEQTRTIESTTERTRVLVEMAPHVTESRLLQELKTSYEQKDLTTTIAGLAPYIARKSGTANEPADIEGAARPEGGEPTAQNAIARLISFGMSRATSLVGPMLARLANKDVVRSLVTMLFDDKGEFRSEVASTLTLIGEQAMDPLETTLSDSRTERRAVAAQVIGMIGGQRATSLLVGAISDPDDKVRQRAAEALSKIGDPSTAAALASALKDESSNVRRAAAEALGTLATEAELDPLVEALGDPDSDVRQAAIQSLISAGEKAGRPVPAARLFELVGSLRDEGSRAKTLVAVAPLLGEDMIGEALEQVRAIELEQVRAEALVGIAPHLPPHLVKEALSIVMALSDTEERAEGLVGLAQYLPEEELERAMNAAEQIGEDLHFWMPETTRSEMMQDLRRKLGATRLQAECGAIGRAVINAQKEGTPVPPLTAQWAQLAERAAQSVPEAARSLNTQIAQMIIRGDTGQARTWVSAGEVLSQALRELESAVLLGNHQIELEYRRGQDERHLEYFLERNEQVEEFRRLMEETGPQARWALHYMGMGGVGKTMLLRHIIARLAPEYSAATSRIDFDHMSPDYPVGRPGQLLIELAEELRLHNPDVETFFETLQQEVISFHESLSDAPPPAHPLDYIRKPEFGFDKVLRSFTGFLEKVAQRVLLILDTAEELAKAPPVESILPSVEATFEILERVYRAVPSMRVIFAGRRPLSLDGDGWEVDKDEIGAESLGDYEYLPSNKQYLRLHVIRGFTKAEAEDFFSKKRKLNLTPQLLDAILGNSPDAGIPADIEWTPTRPEQLSDSRYNPFDLSLYANWVAEDPNLPPERISSGETDSYVKLRIINRLHNKDVETLLPAVVLLRRFNKEMLRPAFHSSDTDLSEAYRVLGSQEWTDYQRDEALKTTFLEVDRNLYPRLLKYYEHESRKGLLDSARRGLGPGLAQRIPDDLGKLSVDHIDAALRLLPDDEAEKLWHQVSLRIPREVDSNWVENVTRTVLGPEGAAGKATSPLRAGVKAAQLSALLHSQPDTDLTSSWREVALGASDSSIGRWLKRRAIAGQIAASRVTKEPPSPELLSAFWQMIEELRRERIDEDDNLSRDRATQLIGSTFAALEGLIERAESRNEIELLNVDAIHAWASMFDVIPVPPDLRAFALMLVGLANALRRVDVSQELSKATSLSEQQEDQAERQRWLDWRAPASLRDRTRLEALRLSRGDEQFDRWKKEALPRIDEIDSERLLSLILRKQLGKGLVAASELELLEREDTYNSRRQPLLEAHRRVPPLFASIAQGWLALGNGDKAIEMINERMDKATQASSDRATQRAAILTKLHVVRRMRMRSRAESLITNMASSGDSTDMTTAWRVLAVTYVPTADTISRSNQDVALNAISGWWSAQQALSYEAAVNAVTSLNELRLEAIEKAKQTDIGQDALLVCLAYKEAAMVAYRLRMAKDLREMEPEFLDQLVGNVHSFFDEDIRLILRAEALDRSIKGIQQLANEVRSRLITLRPRVLAEALLEEGELMALRLPERALSMLEEAQNLFRNAGDPVGALIASIRSMIAAIHAGQHDSAVTMLATVKSSYERLTSSEAGVGLPSWSELESLKGSTESANRSILDHPSWQGWLHRLFRLMVWASSPHHQSQTGVPLYSDKWLQDTYSGQLPVELALAVTASAEQINELNRKQYRRDAAIGITMMIVSLLLIAFVAFATATNPITTTTGISSIVIFVLIGVLISSFDRVRNWPRSLLPKSEGGESLPLPAPPTFVKKGLNALKVAIGLGIMLSLLLLGFFLLGWLIQKVTGARLATGTLLPLYVGLIILIGMSPRLARKLRESLPRLKALDAELAARIEHFFVEELYNSSSSPDVKSPNTILFLKIFGFFTTLAVSTGIVLGIFTAEGRFGPASIGVSGAWILFTAVWMRQFYVAMREEGRSLLAARTQVRLQIDGQRQLAMKDFDPESQLSVTMSLWQRRITVEIGRLFMEPPFKLVPEISTEEVTTTVPSESAPYSSLAMELTAPPIPQMLELSGLLLRRKLPIALRIGPALAPFPWEAAFSLSAPAPQRQLVLDRLQFFRLGDPQVKSATPLKIGGPPRVNLVGSEASESMAQKGWEVFSSKVTINHTLSELRSAEMAEVLHMVGTPVRTTGGFRLQIGRTRQRNMRQASASASESTRPIETRGEVLITPDHLPLRGASLVVVQNDPADIQVRVDSDREQAGYLRAFAAEIFAAGAETVIVLPQMPLALAETALREIATSIQGRSALELQPLLNTVGRLRKLIGGDALAGQSDDDISMNRIELPFDLCVYARWKPDEST